MPLGTEIDLSPGQIILEGDWRPSPLSSERVAEQAAPPLCSAHVYCGQTVAHLSYC